MRVSGPGKTLKHNTAALSCQEGAPMLLWADGTWRQQVLPGERTVHSSLDVASARLEVLTPRRLLAAHRSADVQSSART